MEASHVMKMLGKFCTEVRERVATDGLGLWGTTVSEG